MSGVFLSYSRGDRALAERVLKGLRGLSVDVWWDEDMPGVDWQEELARQINELAAVLVLWTPLSAGSKNVRDEARLGQHTEKLVNALAGVASPPFPFDRINGLPLDGWTGREPHGGWTRLVATVEDRLVAAGAVQPGELKAALARREADIRVLGQALADAEEAYQAAKADEGVAAGAAAEAQAHLAACEDQMRRAAEIAHGPSLLRAAQADLDAAQTARDAADEARKAAATALATASRGFSRARTELERMFGEAPPELRPPVTPPPSGSAAATARPPRAAPARNTTVLIIVGLAIVGVSVVTLAVLMVAMMALNPPRRSSAASAASQIRAAATNAAVTEATDEIAQSVTPDVDDADGADAKAFLVGLYAHYQTSKNDTFQMFDANAAEVFDADTIALLKADAKALKGELGDIDGDWLCDCQDFTSIQAAISVTAATPTTATATADVRDIGDPSFGVRRVGFDLVKADGAWRIHDMTDPGGPSLRQTLQTEIKRLQSGGWAVG